MGPNSTKKHPFPTTFSSFFLSPLRPSATTNLITSSTATAREQKEKSKKKEGRRRDNRRKAEGKYRERGRTTSSVLHKPSPVLLFAYRQQQHCHRKSASPTFIFFFSSSACNLHCSATKKYRVN